MIIDFYISSNSKIIGSKCALGFICAMYFGLGAFAQSPGELRLNIDPGHNFQFILDDQFRMQQRSVKVSSGTHNFKIWAPERAIVDTNLTVFSDSTSFFSMELPFSPEYVQWKKDMSTFQRKFTLYKVVPSVLTVGTGIWAIVSAVNYKNSSDQLQDNRAKYDELVVPREISELKVQLDQDKDDLSSAETQVVISTSVFVVSAVATWFLFKKAKNMEVPVFNDKAKLEFEGLVYNPQQQGTWVGNFKLRF